MTKKLPSFIKEGNKTRRAALTQIKHLVKDKSVMIHYNVQHHVMETHQGIQYTGEHTIILKWSELSKRRNHD